MADPDLLRGPAPGLEPLDALVGLWASRGQTVASDGAPSVAIVGTDDYEWLGGGHFLVHRVHVRFGDQPVDTLELIGESSPEGYAMRSFDNTGATGLMRATVDADGIWTFAGETERAFLELAADGLSMRARWEQLAGVDAWVRWMEMEFTRVG